MSEDRFDVAGLTVRYGKAVAVDGVSIVAPAGKVTAVVGPNGAGKSSLVLAAYGSIPSEGEVRVGAEDLSRSSALERSRNGIALVPQGRQLFPRMTVQENFRIMAELLRLPAAAVDEAMARFPILYDRRASLAGVLSGGEQQMLVVSRALMASPRVLLLDEMMTGLAPKIVRGLADTVRQLADQGVAVVIADPSIGPIKRVIDRGYVLVRGSIVAENDSADALELSYQAAMGIIQGEVAAEAAGT